MVDTTNIAVPSSEKNLAADLIDVYTHGLRQKSLLLRIMTQEDQTSTSTDSSSAYNIFVTGFNFESSLYQDLSILFDITQYSFDRDAKFKENNDKLSKLLTDIPTFIENISRNKLPKTIATVRDGIKHFDDYTYYIKVKGLIELK